MLIMAWNTIKTVQSGQVAVAPIPTVTALPAHG
jgi:hypothetical protein